MPTPFQTGAAVLGQALKTMAGRSITYTQGGQSASLTGTPQKLDYEVDDNDGIPRLVTFYDWTFTTADMLFNAVAFDSRPGDQITETLGGYELTYEAMPPSRRPVAEWMDTANVLRTVHTKLVGRRAV